jgi:hypothetical protein
MVEATMLLAQQKKLPPEQIYADAFYASAS